MIKMEGAEGFDGFMTVRKQTKFAYSQPIYHAFNTMTSFTFEIFL